MKRQHFFIKLLLLSAASVMAGCVSGPLEHDSSNLDLEGDSLVLFRLDTFNEYKPTYTLGAGMVGVIDINDGSEYHHHVGAATESHDKSKKTFLFDIKLKKGSYILTDISGASPNGSPFVDPPSYSFPLYKLVHIEGQKIIYLGRVSITNIKRTSESQERSGRVIPLIPQYGAGFADGTLSAEISDKYEEDSQLFISEFPALSEKSIDKSVFSAWDADNRQIREEAIRLRRLRYKVLEY